MAAWCAAWESAVPGGLQIIIRLDDLAQLVLGGAIAAVGVGMMALHQLLEARLDRGTLGVGLEPEGVQRLALGIAHRAALRLLPRVGRARPTAELAEHAERIVGALVAEEPARARLAGSLAAHHAHLPGRAMAGDRVLLIARDRVLAHAGEKIVGVIVLAHMIETEPPVLALLRAPLRRPVRRRVGAARPFAGRHGIAQPAILVGLDANSVEQGRVELHDRSLCGRRSVSRKLDKFVSPESGHTGYQAGIDPVAGRWLSQPDARCRRDDREAVCRFRAREPAGRGRVPPP